MKISPGFRFIIDDLKIISPAGRKLIFGRKMVNSAEIIGKESDKIEKMIISLKKAAKTGTFDRIRLKMQEFRDIHGTISRITGNNILDDIELFEIKHFAILAENIKEELAQAEITLHDLPEMEEVIRILDPDSRRIPHFYIYSAYSADLGRIREQMKINYGTNNYLMLRMQEQELEQQIREELSKTIAAHSPYLMSAYEKLAELDVMIALAQQAMEMGFCKPTISKEITELKSVFNPAAKKELEENNKKFQPVDIKFGNGPTLLTGANMGGKTILLNSIFICQHMFQFGFFVPAARAKIVTVDDIAIIINENSREQNGLSSFAAEMLNINSVIGEIKKGKKLLTLFDEPARTTNPDEGKAIVNALIEILEAHKVRAVVTTHYNGINTKGQRLRVKGLKTDHISGSVDFDTLNESMDYSVLPHQDTDVPAEALRIAEIIGVDKELIKRARKNFLA